ncbi:hypothetical protein L6164_033487 [Bauhinia variegata]|uniref:Uncharacterized protein n=1 Tax=Bauhinia variegata TaxID=167791 RepID=A0ACB9KRW8_BAUVA|nr:hypothetical protein L6164_033487 [Bauhinia variegata]
MEVNKDDAEGGARGSPQNPHPNPNPSSQQIRGVKGKSCKGALYYSSILKSKSKNPTCVGFSRTLQQVPSNIVGKTELEASLEGRSFTDFKYACIGHSIYLDNKDSKAVPGDKRAKLPVCFGLEVLRDNTSTAPVGQVHPHKSEDGERAAPQTQRPNRPLHPTDEEYTRFLRNAYIVARGVAKNMIKVGNYVKESLDDILYRYRRGPK